MVYNMKNPLHNFITTLGWWWLVPIYYLLAPLIIFYLVDRLNSSTDYLTTFIIAIITASIYAGSGWYCYRVLSFYSDNRLKLEARLDKRIDTIDEYFTIKKQLEKEDAIKYYRERLEKWSNCTINCKDCIFSKPDINNYIDFQEALMADCFRYDKDIELANLINVKCRDLNKTFLFSMKGHTVDNIRVANCKHKVIKITSPKGDKVTKRED